MSLNIFACACALDACILCYIAFTRMSENENVNVDVDDAPSNDGEVVNALRPSFVDALVSEGVVPRAPAPAPAIAAEMCSPLEGWKAAAVHIYLHLACFSSTSDGRCPFCP